ncbi:ATP-dependent DNA helicase RecG, partial [bacterium]
MPHELNNNITTLYGIGKHYLPKLHKLGIFNIKDLLYHFPHRYENFGEVKEIKDLCPGEKSTIHGKIISIKNTRSPRKRMQITEALVSDGKSILKAIWFNQPFLKNTLWAEINVSLSGKVGLDYDTFSMSNPAHEIIPKNLENDVENIPCIQTGGLIPMYPETEGLTSRWLRVRIKSILNLSDDIKEFIPDEILERQGLMSISEAIQQVHFPTDEKNKDRARHRLAFEELFLMQLHFKKQRQQWQKNGARSIPFDQPAIKNFVDNLSFKLTGAQKKATWQILQDLEKDIPMNRLMEGDVGSGKTVVAAIGMFEATNAGFQTALMAPTEVLAEQHFSTISLLIPDQPVMLITGSCCKLLNYELRIKNYATTDTNDVIPCEKACLPKLQRRQAVELIKTGDIKIVIGTHAIIQKDVEFKDLAMAIVDEQHRFGVQQRAALQKNVLKIKDKTPTIVPHLLTMTATPIPRTLALSAYGDLDISILNEMPKGRQKIITKVVAPGDRLKAYEFITSEIKKGYQIFVICPLIEESDTLEVRSVTEEYEKLSKKIFKNFRIAMLHGKMKSKEKEEIMQKFKNREIDILISTSVIEVGIDVPNATVMLIEGSDRFGLA